MVAGEQFKEGRLGARGALAASQLHPLEPLQQRLDVQREVLHPQGRPLADGGQLGRLEMGVGEAGHRGMLPGEGTQGIEHRERPAQDQRQRLADDHQVGVVGDKRTGRAQVQVGSRGGGLLGEGVHVRHDIVAEAALVPRRGGEIGVVEVGAHGRECGVGDVESELPLRLGQGQPHAAPAPDPIRLAPELLHGRRGVASGERRVPAPVVAHLYRST